MSEPAVEPVEPLEPAAEPAPEPQAEPAPEPAAPEPVAQPGFDPDEIEARLAAYEQRNAQLEQTLAQMFSGGQQPQQQPGEQLPQFVDEYGNFDPAAFAAYQAQRDQMLLGTFQQMIAPVNQTLAQAQEAQVVEEGEQRLTDILADDVSRNGEFVPGQEPNQVEADRQARELVRSIANQSFPQIAQRYGGVWNASTGGFDFPTPFAASKAAEAAMVGAAGQVRGLLRAAGGAAVNQHVNHNATLAGQHVEPGTAGVGVPGKPDEILPPGGLAQKYAASAQRLINT